MKGRKKSRWLGGLRGWPGYRHEVLRRLGGIYLCFQIPTKGILRADVLQQGGAQRDNSRPVHRYILVVMGAPCEALGQPDTRRYAGRSADYVAFAALIGVERVATMLEAAIDRGQASDVDFEFLRGFQVIQGRLRLRRQFARNKRSRDVGKKVAVYIEHPIHAVDEPHIVVFFELPWLSSDCVYKCSHGLYSASRTSVALPCWYWYVVPGGTVAYAEHVPLPYQNARYLLISASVLPAANLQSLHGLVPTGLKGTITRAARHNNENGLPFAARERTDLLNLVDEASEYD